MTDHYGLREKKIQVIHNSIPPSFEMNKTLTSLLKRNTFSNSDYFYVSYIGRFSYEKGVDTLIDSIPIVTKQNPKVAFRIFGEGPQLAALERLCQKII